MISIDPESFRRIGELFDALVDLPADERSAKLHALCADAALRAEVEAMLHADARGHAIEKKAREQIEELLDADGESMVATGTLFGVWRVDREIGRGGMGVVFRVDRNEGGFTQRGALKLIKLGMDSEAVVARFVREREVLARLDHVGISRLLDGGMNSDGRPFLVMEYIDGCSLEEHIAGHPTLRERLELFGQICAAVAYAHRHLVIHRDIKPSNIRVTSDGVCKLLDFGIAKLLDDSMASAATMTQARPFTPDYAAPEQLSGGQIGTPVDVYSLGALLHEILTGTRHHRSDPSTKSSSDASSQDETREQTRRDAIPALSARSLRGDLDTIVLRATHTDAERRYASVDALAEDIRRHMLGQAIVARRDRTLYRLSRFVVRNRYMVAALVLVVVVSITAALVSLGQMRKARAQATRAEIAKQFLAGVFEQASPDENNGQPFTARQLLERGEKQRQQLSDMPAEHIEIGSLLARLYWDIGDYDRAQSLAEAAVEEAQASAVPEDIHADALIALARVENELRRFPDAIRHAELAAKLIASADTQRSLEARRQLVSILLRSENYLRAEPMLRALLVDQRKLSGDNSREVASDLVMLATLYYNNGQELQAVEMASDAIGILHELHRAAPSDLLDAQTRLGLSQLHLYRFVEAEAALRDAVKLATGIYGADNIQTWTTQSNVIRVLELEGRLDQAIAERSALLDVQRKALGESNPAQLAIHTKFLAADYRDTSRFAEAEVLFRESLRLTRLADGSDDGADSADTLLHLGYTLQLQGRYAEAENVMKSSYAIMNANSATGSNWLNDTRGRLGTLYRLRGRTAESIMELRAATHALDPGVDGTGGGSPAIRANLLASLSLSELAAGQIDNALASATQSVSLAEKAFPPGNFRSAASLYALARSELAGGQASAAEPLLRRALAARMPPQSANDPRVLEIEVSLVAALRANQKIGEAEALRAVILPLLRKDSNPVMKQLLREMDSGSHRDG